MGGWVERAAPVPETGQSRPGHGEASRGRGKTQTVRSNTQPGRGNTQPGRSNTEPGRGNTEPGRGNTRPSRSTPQPGRGNTQSRRSNTQPGRGGTAGPGPVLPLRARIQTMRRGGMSETGLRRSLGLSQEQAVDHGLIAPRGWGLPWDRADAAVGGGPAVGGAAAGLPAIASAAAGGPAMVRVQRAVARACGLEEAQLRRPGQARELVRARQLLAYLLRELCPGATLSAIGVFLAQDHSTVFHACRRAALRLRREPATRRIYLRLRRELGAAAHG
ncbi:MAG: helix-turn-helix domain-containing protein [Kiloniellales bacterium]